MGYTLTSEDTIRKARELARRTGRSIDDVIDDALTAQLSRPSLDRDEAARQAEIDAALARIRSRPPIKMGDYDADLYDENGMWK